MPRPGRFTPGKDLAPIVCKAGWAPRPVWRGAENLAPAGIWSPDRPVSSESLYRLTYSGPVHYIGSQIYHIRDPYDDKARPPHGGVWEVNYSLSAFWHGYVLHEGITYKSRVPRTSQMTSRLLCHTAAAMRAHNLLCNSHNTRPLLRARTTCYVTVITHGRCYARA
jgi:hypothetical protein